MKHQHRPRRPEGKRSFASVNRDSEKPGKRFHSDRPRGEGLSDDRHRDGTEKRRTAPSERHRKFVTRSPGDQRSDTAGRDFERGPQRPRLESRHSGNSSDRFGGQEDGRPNKRKFPSRFDARRHERGHDRPDRAGRKDDMRRDPRKEHGRRDPARKHDSFRRDVPRRDLAVSGNVLIWGLHAVRAAWLNPKRRCHRLWLTEGAQAAFVETMAKAREDLLKRPDPKKSARDDLDRLTPPGSVHQGIVLEVAALPEPPLHEIITADHPPDLILMLDQVTDPHNVGAVLRSAAALGAGAVIMNERNAPGATGVLAKAASGALEHVPVLHVVNLARALDDLREAGYWSVGLAEEGEKDLSALDLTGRMVLVLGAEGEGLRQLTRKKCDELARLPTGGPIASLNVSNAAAVALYEVRRQKGKF